MQIITSRLQLQDLPDEILISVVSFVTAHKDLRNFACVNQHFNHLAEPFLYDSIEIVQGRHALRLADRIIFRTTRAQLVKSLLVSTKFGEDDGLEVLPPLIAQMRNLKELRLETPDCNQKPAHDRVSWIALQERYERIFESSSMLISQWERCLPNLQTCTLHFVDGKKEIYGLSKYAMLFLHPKLRSLTISCASTDHPHEILNDFQYDTSLQKRTALEYLHLEECDIHPPSLAILLAFARSLKAIKISEGTRYSAEGAFPARKHGDVNPEDLVNALLRHCKDSLQWLSLSLGYVRRPQRNIDSPGEHLNLTRFQNIRHLELGFWSAFLVVPLVRCDHGLWKRLPPRLESLKIFDIPFLNRPPFAPFGREYWPFSDCVIKEKARHGVEHLKLMTFAYCTHSHADDLPDEEDDEDIIELSVNDFDQIRTKLTNAASKAYPMYEKAGIQLKVIVLSLPRGYIPPYLNAEESPIETVVWDKLIS